MIIIVTITITLSLIIIIITITTTLSLNIIIIITCSTLIWKKDGRMISAGRTIIRKDPRMSLVMIILKKDSDYDDGGDL